MSEPTTTKSVNFVARVTALAIDFLLLETIHLTLLLLLAASLLPEIYTEFSAIPEILAFFLLVSLVSFFFLHMTYFTLFHAVFGQTVGKMIMGIRVVTAERMPPALSVSFLRWCGYILSALPLAAGFLWAAVDREHCAWHDTLAGTRVISTEMT